MDFRPTLTALRPEIERLRECLVEFMRDIYRGERMYPEQHAAGFDRWTIASIMEDMKARAPRGVWIPAHAQRLR